MNKTQLRALRLKLDLTQKQMGERLGITPSAVAHLESGTNTMSKPVAILCQQLETGFEMLKTNEAPF